MEVAVRQSLFVPGDIIEFGVYQGHSVRAIQKALKRYSSEFPAGSVPTKAIYACDSFEGLPEKFEQCNVGTFKTEPPHLPGIHIVKGYFENSLTPKLAREIGKVSFAHLDADLYSSTMCALTWLTPLLRTGSLLAFDEFLGEGNSEKRAFQNWMQQTGVRCMQVAEFLREPSGHSDTLDQRVFYQVLGVEDLDPTVTNPPAPRLSFGDFGAKFWSKLSSRSWRG
jgi:hypothetical protein